MILDLQALFSENQLVVATAASTNVIDLGVPGKTGYNGIQLVRKMKHHKIPFLFQVVENFNNLTSLKVAVQQSVDSAFTTPVELYSETILLADLKIGKRLAFDSLPKNITARFIRVHYTVTGTAPTTGKVTSGIVAAVDAPYVG